ncbi:FAD-dependent oxidoreductase [Pedobacter sp. BS3]|uniref:FAD-dependent oxidoreductase n=1 Tax=Pedobacter sp. BS3 TaxID=2567937 RepID=UPI0011EF0C2D|nr:FAD-dependent oxidoreductase [Pedobacter sp. BS3]TZF84912.1 FAD-dependent oxidoreductase [Pedobacter sp. BS3]
MKNTLALFLLILTIPTFVLGKAEKEISVDICIYGGTSAGVISAYTAAKAGKKVIIIEPGARLGGLSSGGLGMTDIGNKYVVTGLALDFYRKLGAHYGNLENWVFEPKVALGIFNDYIKKANINVVYNRQLIDVKKEKRNIKEITVTNLDEKNGDRLKIKAKMFLDCTYEGDLFAMAGVSYHVGREDNKVYNETLNGVQLLKGHQLPDGVDPYKVKGDPSSGLLWGISNETLKPNGTGDKKVQAYNFRIALTNDPANRIPITKPDNYDPKRYELLVRQKEIQPWKGLSDVFIWSLMPNNKTDINNRNGMSTDMIGANWEYPEADYRKRKKIIREHEDYTKGLLYFVGNDPAVPEFIRKEMQKWGYPKDEYLNNNHWTPQLYIREARRMVSDVVMTQHHCQGREVVTDDIAYAAYTMDSHNCDRLVVNGMVKNEGNVEVGGFPPFPISYRSIVPKRTEINNLLVPVCLSASHIAYGSIRMEPVFMVLAQSAAVAACLALDKHIAVQDVNVDEVKAILKANPKADFRKPDVLVQVSDTAAVEVKGDWKKVSLKGYGKYHLENSSGNSNEYVKFNLGSLASPGRYTAYYYLPALRSKAETANLELFDGKSTRMLSLNLKDVKIVGQTTSTWVEIGDFNFDFAAGPYVKIVASYAHRTVAANAILLVPKD